MTLDIKEGQSVGIVGPSGSGKSTLLRLLLRAYDVTGGSVSVDGVDVRELKMDSLRENIAIVPQDTVLFNDTLAHNLRYGRASATDEEVMRAAADARLDDTLAMMPEGLDTMVGERGVKLSGGEKQRVAIARAFLRSPRLLLADEATSALDTATEVGILQSLQEVAEGRTAVFVAHRLSTVRNCDLIVVMQDGRVVERVRTRNSCDPRGREPRRGCTPACGPVSRWRSSPRRSSPPRSAPSKRFSRRLSREREREKRSRMLWRRGRAGAPHVNFIIDRREV